MTHPITKHEALAGGAAALPLSQYFSALVSAGAESQVLRITAQSARWRAGE